MLGWPKSILLKLILVTVLWQKGKLLSSPSTEPKQPPFGSLRVLPSHFRLVVCLGMLLALCD